MSILDAYGREVRLGKPITDEIGGVSSIRDRYSTYPSQGLTPERLTAIFKQADMGDVSRQAELFEEMEEKDAHLAAVLQTRKLAVAGLPWEVTAASEDKEDEKVADFIREALTWIENWDDALVGMLDSVGRGFSVSEIMWELDNKRVWIKDIRWRHQKKFTFYSKDRVLDYPMLVTDAQPTYGEELPPFKFIFHRAGGRAGNVARAGALRACAWMYLFKNYTVKDWVIFAERFAMPMRVGKYSPGAGDKEKEVLKNAVFNLGADAAAVISESTMIELLEQKGKVGSAQIYDKLIDVCDKAVSKAVLGHSASADSTPGKLGNETGARDVRQDLLEADSKALSKTVIMQLIYPLVVYNFGPDKNLPRFSLQHEEGEDLGAAATTYKTLGEAGLRIPAAHVYEKFGIPQPEGDEEVLERTSAPLPFKDDVCACKHHNPVRRVALAARDEADEWVSEYLSRLSPSLKGAREDALKRIEEYLAAQAAPPAFEDFDAEVQGILGDAYTKVDRAAVEDAVTGMYAWWKFGETLGPGVSLGFGGPDIRAMNFLSRVDYFYHSKWVKNPQVNRALTDFLKERYFAAGEGIFGRGDPASIQELKSLLSQKMVELSEGQVNRIVDTSVQRTRNWAHISQLNDAAVTEIEIYEPTQDCDFCVAMHGTVYRVETAFNRMQELAMMDPADYEAELRREDRRPVLGNEGAFAAGAELPPYHPFCRGRVIRRTG